jgi:hypothetical protein
MTFTGLNFIRERATEVWGEIFSKVFLNRSFRNMKKRNIWDQKPL